MIILSCPFCGGKAELSCQYDSDDNRPDGHQWFIQCGDCGSKGTEFYAVEISDGHLNKQQREKQRKEILEAQLNALDAWNKRS